jgi:hypothetical protein
MVPMKTIDQLVGEVTDDLRGTCKSLNDVLSSIDREDLENNKEFLDALDEEIFCCDKCSWWSEISEMAEDCGDVFICQECHDDESDDE